MADCEKYSIEQRNLMLRYLAIILIILGLCSAVSLGDTFYVSYDANDTWDGTAAVSSTTWDQVSGVLQKIALAYSSEESLGQTSVNGVLGSESTFSILSLIFSPFSSLAFCACLILILVTFQLFFYIIPYDITYNYYI